jgi:regulator of cell morphogenesis and NO signaling
MEQGYDFFSRITHPDDLSLLDGVRGIILQGLSSYSDELDDLDYLSFKFRIRNYPELMESDYQMVYQKITSATISNNTQSVICFMTNAVTQTSGHLRSYNKHGLLYKVFSFQSNKWVEPNPEDLEKLTPREALTVKYIEQGKSVEEIAEIFHRTYNTIQSHIRNICRKLNLHSMGDLVVYAPTHKLIFIPKKLKTKN